MGHMHDDEIHTHEHTHEDGQVHSHVHSHDDGHGRTHSHDDGHEHSHEDAHPAAETKALLAYMIQHNAHHADELAGLMDSLPKDAQRRLSLALGTFEAANVELQEVLECLE